MSEGAAVIALVGTLDTKGAEYEFLRGEVRRLGADAVLIDVGILGESTIAADFDRERVATMAGAALDELVSKGDRAAGLRVMATGAVRVLDELIGSGKCDAVLVAGGSGASTIALRVFEGLPLAVPKVLVTTQVGSAGAQLAATSNVILLAPLVDVAGLNRITRTVLAQAAGAAIGASAPGPTAVDSRRAVFATMLGLTTDGVTAARSLVEQAGYEVITFHATGAGGRAMERLVGEMRPRGVLALTTVEIADEIAGGTKAAGSDRLLTAGRLGLPYVVAPGGTDMIRFGSVESVPPHLGDRKIHVHNDLVTLVRTSPDECRRIAERIVDALERSAGPCALVIPTRGFSALSTERGPFHDPDCDDAFLSVVRSSAIRVVEVDDDINGRMFAETAAGLLMEMLEK